MDAAPDDTPDVELLTYAELGARRGISRSSAERLARRRKWKRVTGNDGLTRLAVPRDEATLSPDSPADVRVHRVDPVPALRAAVETLRDQLRREGARADRAEAQIDEARSAVLRAELAGATAAERLAQMEAAETHRRARGRWARLRDAWRGE